MLGFRILPADSCESGRSAVSNALTVYGWLMTIEQWANIALCINCIRLADDNRAVGQYRLMH
jgi:hypothetical protein